MGYIGDTQKQRASHTDAEGYLVRQMLLCQTLSKRRYLTPCDETRLIISGSALKQLLHVLHQATVKDLTCCSNLGFRYLLLSQETLENSASDQRRPPCCSGIIRHTSCVITAGSWREESIRRVLKQAPAFTNSWLCKYSIF